jgi:SAM-dependent methyltransferase
MRYGFSPPPPDTDLVGYEALIEFFRDRNLMAVPGDLVEIGAFRGGGTYKLAKLLQKQGSRKKVYTIDCFDIQLDRTRNVEGLSMAEIYHATLEGKSQRKIFDQVTAGIPNIVVIEADSKEAELPAEAVCFGFIDGNHSDEYVRNDFYLVWRKLSPGGVVAFHDYGHDLPNVTATIDLLRARHVGEITEAHVDRERHIIYLRKAKPELKNGGVGY